jgi:hypothetical protein
MKTLIKKLSSQALSCITNQPFSSDNGSSIWGGVDINGEPSSVLPGLWSATTNQPDTLMHSHTVGNNNPGPSAMKLSIDTLTSISTSNNSIADSSHSNVESVTSPTAHTIYIFRSLTSASEQIASTSQRATTSTPQDNMAAPISMELKKTFWLPFHNLKDSLYLVGISCMKGKVHYI